MPRLPTWSLSRREGGFHREMVHLLAGETTFSRGEGDRARPPPQEEKRRSCTWFGLRVQCGSAASRIGKSGSPNEGNKA